MYKTAHWPGYVTLEPAAGMHCGSCTSKVERTLLAIRGVSSADVSLVLERAEVRFDPGITPVEEVAAAVTALGFPCSVISRPVAPATGCEEQVAVLGIGASRSMGAVPAGCCDPLRKRPPSVQGA